jgi:D-alanyl-lipoteichoic acid acyltransferase DltB (MBOAT superfamily)
MLFTSVEFLVFLPIVFALYWILARRLKWQNALIVVASYVFYGWWDWRFLVLIAFISLCSYLFGLMISKSMAEGENRKARRFNVLNIVINIAILAVFKYHNFFVESLMALFPSIGAEKLLLNLILPVGISFYTFQALSYTIDVYRQKN